MSPAPSRSPTADPASTIYGGATGNTIGGTAARRGQRDLGQLGGRRRDREQRRGGRRQHDRDRYHWHGRLAERRVRRRGHRRFQHDWRHSRRGAKPDLGKHGCRHPDLDQHGHRQRCRRQQDRNGARRSSGTCQRRRSRRCNRVLRDRQYHRRHHGRRCEPDFGQHRWRRHHLRARDHRQRRRGQQYRHQ